jgi:hypothetical protein
MERYDADTDYTETFPLLQVYKRAVLYARAHNAGKSVTVGGPLFYQPRVALDDDEENPFDAFHVVEDLFAKPDLLEPGSPMFAEVKDKIDEWSEFVWIHLGGQVEDPLPNPAPQPEAGVGGGQLTDEGIRSIMAPLVNDKVFRESPRTAAKYRLLFARRPGGESATPHLANLGGVKDDFLSYLREAKGAAAAHELQEMVRSAIEIANRSRLSVDRDVTFNHKCATLAFIDRIRIFKFHTERLVGTSLEYAKDNIGMIHFLTPKPKALSVVAEGDSHVHTMVMANVSDNKTQVEATKSSQTYTGGKMDTFLNA